MYGLIKAHKQKTIEYLKEKVKNNVTSLSNIKFDDNNTIKNINDTINKKNIQLDKITICLENIEPQL